MEERPILQSNLLREIRALEFAQARPLREIAMAIDEDSAAAARAKLEEIDAAIAVLRAQIQTIVVSGTA